MLCKSRSARRRSLTIRHREQRPQSLQPLFRSPADIASSLEELVEFSKGLQLEDTVD